jgi:hypothetical protein
MRIVYRNVGETAELIGLYPFEPLHDMRRALQTLDPRKNQNITAEQRKLARDAILQSFYSLREKFLEELDLEEPANAVLAPGSRRRKRSGTVPEAKHLRERQVSEQESLPNGRGTIDEFLFELHAREQARIEPASVPRT